MSDNSEKELKINSFILGLENFKAFKELQTIEIKPLTIICGVNNSGKSSLIHSLLMLSQTVKEWETFVRIPTYDLTNLIPKEEKKYKTNLLFEGKLCHLSHYGNVLNIYAKDKWLKFDFDFKDSFSLSISFFNPFIQKMIKAFVKHFEVKGRGYHLIIDSKLDKKLNIEYYTCKIVEMSLKNFISHFPLLNNFSIDSSLRTSTFDTIITDFFIEKVHITFNGFIPQRLVIPVHEFQDLLSKIFKRFSEHNRDIEKIKDGFEKEFSYIIEREQGKDYGKFENCFILFEFNEFKLIERFCQSIHYIGPLRDEPHRYYQFSDIRELSIGNKGEFAPQILTLYGTTMIPDFKIITSKDGRISFEDYNFEKKREEQIQQEITDDGNYITLIDGLNKWAEILNFPKINTDKIEEVLSKVLISLPETDSFLTLQDVGFGISQVFPIIIESLRMETGDTIILEQPEIHLHPNMQSKLADFLLSMTASDKRFFIETHSEHLINRLCLRIAQDPTNQIRDLISLVFIERKRDSVESERSGSIITKLRLNKYGEVENWPIGFFDETDYNDLLIAGINKRKLEKERDED